MISAVVSCFTSSYSGGIVSFSTFGSRVFLSFNGWYSTVSISMFQILTFCEPSRICLVVERFAFTPILPMAPDMSQSPP